MSSPREEEAVSRAIELLLDCANAHERTGVLLDTLLDSGLCTSAALWRQVGRGKVRAWHPILARGPASALPTLEQLRHVAAGDLPSELGEGRVVILPIGSDEFALTIGAPASPDEEPLDAIESLFQVWLAVELAESTGAHTDLLAALPSLGRATDSPSPSAAMAQQPAWGGSRGRDLTRFLEREAAWILGPAVSFEVEAEDLPPLAADPLQLEACLRELLSHAGAGQTGLARVVRLRITAGDAAAPGARITVEDDAGWPPSLVGRPGGRGSGRLFAVARAIQDQGGDLRLDPSALGGTKVALWLPQA